MSAHIKTPTLMSAKNITAAEDNYWVEMASSTISLAETSANTRLPHENHQKAQTTHSLYLHPTIIMATEKIFSPSVVGAMFPNPMVVKLVMVKYRDVMYRESLPGPPSHSPEPLALYW